MRGFTPLSFPPRKRGPRNRGGAAVTERTSAQRAFRRHGVGLPFVRSNPSSGQDVTRVTHWWPIRSGLASKYTATRCGLCYIPMHDKEDVHDESCGIYPDRAAGGPCHWRVGGHDRDTPAVEAGREPADAGG